MDGYPFETEIQVRFRDIDAMGHVNNVVYGTYFEMAREALFREAFGVAEATDFTFILARLEMDFRRQVRYEDRVRVGLREGEVGRTSFSFEYRLEAAGELAAEGRSVQVCYDYAAKAKAPLSEAFKTRLASLRKA